MLSDAQRGWPKTGLSYPAHNPDECKNESHDCSSRNLDDRPSRDGGLAQGNEKGVGSRFLTIAAGIGGIMRRQDDFEKQRVELSTTC